MPARIVPPVASRPLLTLLSWGAALCATLVMPTQAAETARLPADHPILGTWFVNLPQFACSETYLFKPDQTTLVTSGEEVAESRFEVSANPSAQGFYKVIDTVVRDNGKKDCSGGVTQVGHVVTNYLRFHPSGEMMVMCQDESFKACLGPFRRVRGQAL
jgi:hypothetical protein